MDWRRQEINRELNDRVWDDDACSRFDVTNTPDLTAQSEVEPLETRISSIVRYATITVLLLPVLLLLRNLF